MLAIGLLCLQQAYSQRMFVNSRVNTAQFKSANSAKARIIENFQLRSKTSVVDLFTFNPDVLQDSSFVLNVFPGTMLTVTKDEVEQRGKTDFSWHGHIQGAKDKEGSLVLVFMDGHLSGNLNYREKNYALHPMGKGMFAIYEIDTRKFPREDAPGPNDKVLTVPTAGVTNLTASSVTPSCNLRILVVFTPEAETNIINSLGYPNIQQFAQQAIAESNQGFLNSNVSYRMELGAAIRTNYTESGDYNTDISRFVGTTDGYMDEIHTYRNLYSADESVLIFNNNAYCGLADAIQASATTAFCVVHYECALGYYSFGHELAHLSGCRHDPQTDPTTTPYAYGHGYVYSAGGWRTIMAYNINGETRLQYYSNPTITYGGVPMGTTTVSYNAKVLNQTIGTVAGFRSAPSTLTLDNTASLTNYETGDAQAVTSITMNPGFEVSGGSTLNAYIKSCTDLVNGSSVTTTGQTVTDANTLDDQNSNKSNTLHIYPDPSSGLIYIAAGELTMTNSVITVNDQLGRQVYLSHNDIDKNTITLDLSFLADGVYYIQIKNSTSTVTKKVVISK
ncbi:MAG TPA: zinc-dependent metalloprotease [Puia sp.]|nr:zinc-dependent metalloprotease [Puia sp.]